MFYLCGIYKAAHNAKERWCPLGEGAGLIGASLLILLFLALALRVKQLIEQNRQLQEIARRDHLTGLFNRREFDERLSTQTQPFSILMVDIDHFKTVNDSHGHAAGDAVLEGLARRLLGHLRTQDVPYRYGGEEFVVLAQVPWKDLEGVARRLLQALNGDYRAGDQSLPITVSIGCATQFPGEDTAALMRRADKALYRAKKNGRCRVELAS